MSGFWLGWRDLNPRWQSQSLLPYHLATPQNMYIRRVQESREGEYSPSLPQYVYITLTACGVLLLLC